MVRLLWSLGLALLSLPVIAVDWVSRDLRPPNYKRNKPPFINDTNPVQVFLKLEIVSILDVSEFDQSFTVDVDYRLRWKDHRLTWPESSHDNMPRILDMSWKTKLWIPDIYFKNALQTKQVHGAVTPITHIEVNSKREVSLNTRLQVQLICDMELFAYPHDRQVCFLDSTSLSYTPTHVQLTWDSFDLDETIYFPKFRIDSHAALPNCSSASSSSRDDKSCIRGSISFSRKVSFYATRFYGPTIFITSTTFLGYYIGADVTSARLSINLSPLLCLIMMHNVVNSEIQSSYVVGLHIWMFVCMFFTFMGLAEFVLALTYEYRIKSRKDQQKKEEQVVKGEPEKQLEIVRRVSRVLLDGSDAVMPKTSLGCKMRLALLGSLILVPRDESGDGKGDRNEKRKEEEGGSAGAPKRGSPGIPKAKKNQKKKMKKKRQHKSNPIDLFARFCAPICFSVFAVCYFTYFENYSQT